MKKITVVIPTHNEENNLIVLIPQLQEIFTELQFELECILVDDGSTDSTLNEIRLQSALNNNVHFVELSKNFGKDNAIQAGIQMATGNAVITMDADLQHPPRMINALIENWERGYDIVYAYRNNSNVHAKTYQKITSRLFYKIINLLSDIQLEDGISDYRLLDRAVVDYLKQFNEYDIFLRGIVKWVGFRQVGIPYSPQERLHGKASYSFFKLFKLALNGMMSFSVRPLYAVTAIGIIVSVCSMLYIPYIFISIITGITVSGWASLIATIAFLGGLQLFCLGIISMYLGKLFMQSKHRPNYIIRSSNLIKKEHDLVKF